MYFLEFIGATDNQSENLNLNMGLTLSKIDKLEKQYENMSGDVDNILIHLGMFSCTLSINCNIN